MHNLKAFLFGILLIPSIAFGVLSEGDKANFPIQNRLLTNPSFEFGKTGWTASAGTFSVTTTAKASGALGAEWNASASSQTLKSTLTAVPDGLKGRNGAASCVFKAASGTATHTLTVDDGTNNLVTPATISSSTTSFQRTTVNFIYPTSGSVEIKITSAADEPNTYIDSCYFDLAEGFNVGTTIPVTPWTSYTATFSAGWGSVSNISTWWRQVGDTMEIKGTFTSGPSLTGSAARISIPSGYTFDTGKKSGSIGSALGGWITAQNSTAAYTHNAVVPFIDTAQTTNVSFSNTGDGSSQKNLSEVLANVFWATSTSESFYITGIPITQFSGSVAIYRPDTSAFIWSGYHDSNCDFTTTSGSYALPTGDASCTFTETNNVNAGTVASQTNGGNNSSGISWTPNSTGKYKVCAIFTGYNDTSGQTINAMLYDSVAGNGPTQNGRAAAAGTYSHPFNLCRTLDVSSLAVRTTEVRAAVGANTGHIAALGFTGDRSITWSIEKLSQNIPMPILVGGVKGTVTNDNPTAGYVGEVLESIVNTGTNVPGASTAFGTTNCSVSATAGDWMFGGAVEEQLNGATASGQVRGGLSANGVLNADGDDIFDALPATSTSNSTVTIPAKRFSLASTTTIALQIAAAYSAGTPKYVCRLTGWRIR